MKADAILCGDIHIRDKVPVARTDDYLAAMWRKLTCINQLALDNDCPVMCSGDFFDHWKTAPELLNPVLEILTAKWLIVYGDHELPNHSIKLKHKSGLTTLAKAGKVTIVRGGHGNSKGSNELPKSVRPIVIGERKLMLWHVLTWHKELPYPGCENSNAKSLLKKYKQYDCIITGDNHKPFVVKHKDRMLVNVGSMMRNNADQINYKPAVWKYYAETNTVEPVYLSIEEGVISRKHIEVVNARNERIDAFISKVKTDFKLTMDFKQNIVRFFGKNKTHKKVKKIIMKNMEV